MPNMYNTKAVY